ncbi:hypothetical protein OV450_1351 [Actinobacteria bacterium OV450]|nr:hypothetical protein OV450_1351 [Actinobacteria bacterium OV450]
MAVQLLAVNDLAEDVLACICVALDQAATDVPGQPGCPTCRSCLVPGTVSWDSCEDPCGPPAQVGGQLTVSVARVFPSTSFPSEDREIRGLRGCTQPTYMAVELVITLLRCVPGPTDDGCPPSCEDLAAAAKVLHVDLASVYNALLCCLPQTTTKPGSRRYVIGASKTVGPDGGCVGLEQRVTVGLYGCYACPEG